MYRLFSEDMLVYFEAIENGKKTQQFKLFDQKPTCLEELELYESISHIDQEDETVPVIGNPRMIFRRYGFKIS